MELPPPPPITFVRQARNSRRPPGRGRTSSSANPPRRSSPPSQPGKTRPRPSEILRHSVHPGMQGKDCSWRRSAAAAFVSFPLFLEILRKHRVLEKFDNRFAPVPACSKPCDVKARSFLSAANRRTPRGPTPHRFINWQRRRRRQQLRQPRNRPRRTARGCLSGNWGAHRPAPPAGQLADLTGSRVQPLRAASFQSTTLPPRFIRSLIPGD